MILKNSDWRDLSCHVPEGQFFIFGDVHGRSSAFRAMMEDIQNIPRASDRRELISLGDIIDRGPGSVSIIQQIDALKNMPRSDRGFDKITLLPGNHEISMLDDIRHREFFFWPDMGGHALLEEIGVSTATHSSEEIIDILEMVLPDWYLREMLSGPTYLKLGDLICIHAGLLPLQDIRDQIIYLQEDRFKTHKHHWAWIRDIFLDWTQGWDEDGKTVVLHGHTQFPENIQEPRMFLEAADLVQSHRRINLDAGSVKFSRLGWCEIIGGRDPAYRVHLAIGDPIEDDAWPGLTEDRPGI